MVLSAHSSLISAILKGANPVTIPATPLSGKQIVEVTVRSLSTDLLPNILEYKNTQNLKPYSDDPNPNDYIFI
jgi:hypothetical protein